jgi:hypothetical protein
MADDPTDDDYFKASSLAKLGLMRQTAIYQAITTGRLKAKRENGKLMISRKDFQDYLRLRYDRSRSTFEGQPLFDPDKGECSVRQGAKLLRMEPSNLYYYIRMGYIPAKRKGKAYVLHVDDVQELKKKLTKL